MVGWRRTGSLAEQKRQVKGQKVDQVAYKQGGGGGEEAGKTEDETDGREGRGTVDDCEDRRDGVGWGTEAAREGG